VEARKYEHISLDYAIDKAVRESPEHRSTLVVMHKRKGQRILRHTGDERLCRLEKLIAQPGALTLVPPVRLIKLRRRSWLEENAAQ
jgi:hypothetical protein